MKKLEHGPNRDTTCWGRDDFSAHSTLNAIDDSCTSYEAISVQYKSASNYAKVRPKTTPVRKYKQPLRETRERAIYSGKCARKQHRWFFIETYRDSDLAAKSQNHENTFPWRRRLSSSKAFWANWKFCPCSCSYTWINILYWRFGKVSDAYQT